jgi:nucleoid DNA-binding protein
MAAKSNSKSKAKAMTKSALITALADQTELTRKEVRAVLEELTNMAIANLSAGGPEVFTLPGLVKIRLRERPARPEREGINPRTGEKIMIPAKPAHKVVKATPLKALKDSVLS